MTHRTEGDTEWVSRLGPNWRTELGIFAILLVAVGTLTPLSDPDLPLHLALGKWMVEHGAVPVVEPFAWTRQGAPFYAYSWAMDLLFYGIHSAFGPLGLRLLHGLLLMLAAASIIVLARAASWRPWTALFVAMVHVVVLSLVVAALRPQMMLGIAVPLAWAAGYRILSAERIRQPAAILVLCSALLVNSHLLFPLTAAPWILLFTRPTRQVRRMVAMVAAVVVGWLLSPYALQLPQVFRLNFALNALQTPFSPIIEMRPGFLLSIRAGIGPILLAAGLTLLPWGLIKAQLSVKERIAFAGYWLVGLVMFALASRALLVWWLLVLPIAAHVIDRLREPEKHWVKQAQKVLIYVFCTLLLLGRATVAREGWLREQVAKGSVSSAIAESTEPLFQWLECHARPRGRARVYTTFNIGNYLIWRMPGYSPSIDGRVIFPDSVSKAEAFVFTPTDSVWHGPWRSADLAIIPMSYRMSGVLDTASGWRRAAVSQKAESDFGERVGLWVKESWWKQVAVPACSINTGRRPSP